jgi:hypothetical protein
METTSGKETITVLRRLIAYSEKIFQLSKDIVTQVSDRREQPRISTAAVVKSSLVLFWARLGSINSWEQVGRARFGSLGSKSRPSVRTPWDESMRCSMPTVCGKGFTTFTSA